ncbi:MAG TPA: MurR/RpiR family transcriptional regulator, partial [Acidimicrobiales bacterium]|nr:MurR/RpiR family transcriptional regulator [Acidimicrobiales bacterium]
MNPSKAATPPRDPTGSYTLERIRSMTGSLSASELRVAQTILDHPQQVLEWSAAEIATNSDTSDATAVRTCRRLGFSGLRELRLTLARDLGWPTTSDLPDHATKKRPFIHELFDAAARSLSSMVSKESAAGFSRGVSLLAAAGRIFVVSNGPSSVFAKDFVYSARVAGLRAEFWDDTIMQSIVANQLAKKDVCVAVSASGVNALTIDGAETARAAGAKVLAVTGYGLSRLAEIATVTVVAETFDYSTTNQAAINSAGLLLLLRGLVIATTNSTGERSQASRDAMRDYTEATGRFVYR